MASPRPRRSTASVRVSRCAARLFYRDEKVWKRRRGRSVRNVALHRKGMQAGRRHADPRAILALVCEPAGMDERCLDEVPFKRVIARQRDVVQGADRRAGDPDLIGRPASLRRNGYVRLRDRGGGTQKRVRGHGLLTIRGRACELRAHGTVSRRRIARRSGGNRHGGPQVMAGSRD